jgi:putative molybdopterin biosynthesis protein
MSEDVSYTTSEIAKLLKISKLTVYDLIKKNELLAYRVGRQMRVDAKDLDSYKTKAKNGNFLLTIQPAEKKSTTVASPKAIVITGQDASLDILSTYMEKKIQGARPLRSYVGSLDSLIAMYQGKADLVSCHLLDGDTGVYNLPYIRRILVGQPVLVIGLAARTAGLFTQEGNPLGINKWQDLGKPNLRLANREKGSGARVLLDEQLRIHGMKPDDISGYEEEELSHLAVAGKIAGGQADIGVGTQKAAKWVGIDFVPLILEKLDLVMLSTPENMAWITEVVNIIQSSSYQNELESIGGYDLTHTGHIEFHGYV